MFQTNILYGERAVNDVWRHGDNTWHQGNGGVYFAEEIAELMKSDMQSRKASKAGCVFQRNC